MANTMTLIQSVTVPSGGASSIDFTSIPSTYTDLCLKVSVRSTVASGAADNGLNMSINGVTTNRSWKRVESYNGNSPTSDSGTNSQIGVIGGTSVTANTFTSEEIYIPNYSGSSNKSFSVDLASENNSTTSYDVGFMAHLWSSTSAINQLTFTAGSGNIAQYSTAYLYGIRNS